MSKKVVIKRGKAEIWNIAHSFKTKERSSFSTEQIARIINRIIKRGVSPYTLNVLHGMPEKSILIGTHDLSYIKIPIRIELKEIAGHTPAADLMKNPKLGIGLVYEIAIKNKKTNEVYWSHTLDYSKASLYNIFVDYDDTMSLGDFMKDEEFTEADIIKYVYRAICKNMRYIDLTPVIRILNKNSIYINLEKSENGLDDYSFKCIFDDDYYLEDDDDEDDD